MWGPVLFASLALAAPQERFDQGITALRAGDAPAAEAALRQSLAEGARDPAVYHGLGNALYRQGELGPAIAAWRRGLLLSPSDGDIAANLDRARRETQDRLDAPAPSTGPFFWQRSLSPRQSGLLASALATLALAVPLLSGLGKRVGSLRRVGALADEQRWIGWVALLLAALLGTSTWVAAAAPPSAVVGVPQVSVRSALGPDGVELFVLHEGAEVGVAEQTADATLVVLPDDRKGWVPALALISADPAAPFPDRVL